MPDASYSYHEVTAILRLATERQQAAPSVEQRLPRLSLVEVEQVAARAGLSAEHVREAAAAYERARHTPFPKPEDGVVTERLFDGAMSEAEWHDVVCVARHHFGAHGYAQSLGSNHEWFFSDQSSSTIEAFSRQTPDVHLSVHVEDGMTRLCMVDRRPDHGLTLAVTVAGVLLVVAVPTLFAFTGAGAPSYGPVSVLVAALGVMGLGTLAGVLYHRKKTHGMHAFLDEVRYIIAPAPVVSSDSVFGVHEPSLGVVEAGGDPDQPGFRAAS